MSTESKLASETSAYSFNFSAFKRTPSFGFRDEGTFICIFILKCSCEKEY